MPFYLEESDVLPRAAGLRSVLIVPCRFCPAASLAVRENKPFLEPFRRFLRTGAYESFIRDLQRRFREHGITTAVFDARLPHHFLPCMWTDARRRRLARRAAGFDGVVVLGCEAAVDVVRGAVGHLGRRVIQGMEVEGVMAVVPTVSFPLDVSLSVRSLTPVAMKEPRARGPRMSGDTGDR